MNRHLQKLQEIFCDVFDDDQIVISARTTVKDIDGWDSLMHINLIIAVEKCFRIQFATAEIVPMKEDGWNLGDLLELLEKKIGHTP